MKKDEQITIEVKTIIRRKTGAYESTILVQCEKNESVTPTEVEQALARTQAQHHLEALQKLAAVAKLEREVDAPKVQEQLTEDLF